MNTPQSLTEVATRIVNWVDDLQGREMQESQVQTYAAQIESNITAFLNNEYNEWFTYPDLSHDIVSNLISEIDGFLPEDVLEHTAKNVDALIQSYAESDAAD